MKDLPVKELMTPNVIYVGVHTPLLDALKLMKENVISCLVIAVDHRPIGIFTERDAVRFFVDYLEFIDYLENHEHDVGHVGSYMTSPIISIKENTPIFDALVLVQLQKIRHLPVTDDEGKITGLITYSDLVKHKQYLLEHQDELILNSVSERTRDLEQANEALRVLSLEDALLNIGNRRAMEVDLQYTHQVSVRYKRPYTVVLIDVDHFKKYNDHYGHQAGDNALQAVAKFIKDYIRGADRVYRYGGEELLLLLPETCLYNAGIMVGRVINGISELQIPHEESPLGRLTISAGIASQDPTKYVVANWEKVVLRADAALYDAKEAGRNQYAIKQITTELTIAS